MKLAEQARALRLRKSGKSVKEIARILHVSQSSASVWCQGVRLSDAHRLALAQRRRIAGAKALAPVNAKRSKARLVDMNVQERNGKQDAGVLTARDVHMFGLGLYWGEGYKRGSLEWGFTNSDPEIITSIIEWLRCCYAIESDRLGARLTINEQYRGESERLHREWAAITGIPRANFSMPSFITGYGKIGRDPRTYRGTLRIKVRRSTSLRRRILASIAEASRQITLNSRKTRS